MKKKSLFQVTVIKFLGILDPFFFVEKNTNIKKFVGGGGPYCPCVYVVQVFDKSPAFKDGRIRCGDEIVAINGITVKGERKSAVAQLIQVSLNPVKVCLYCCQKV